MNLIYADLRDGARTDGLTIMMRETETEKENSVTKASAEKCQETFKVG